MPLIEILPEINWGNKMEESRVPGITKHSFALFEFSLSKLIYLLIGRERQNQSIDFPPTKFTPPYGGQQPDAGQSKARS